MEPLNYLLAFIEGLALILSPCILPILPLLLSGSLTGSKKKPLGIICGFSLVFALSTLGAHFLIQSLHINFDVLRNIAFILIILFGCILASDYLSEKFSRLTNRLANSANQLQPATSAEGFRSGFILGSLISLIWTPCAGPVLAAALIQIALQKNIFSSFLALFFFALGSVLPMILLALLGKKVLEKIQFLKKSSHLLRKICGYLMIFFSVILLFISTYQPDFFARLANEQTPQTLTSSINAQGLTDALIKPYPAPAIIGITTWINSPPLSLDKLKNKVVLIDFWTYSCINCLRTLPYLIDWDRKYRDKGLVIIGVHSPEFAFEKDVNNVKRAVENNKIFYPVALDNNYTTWLNYHNHYWPAHYLIDQQGMVVYQHYGEGKYAETENNIRQLLGLNKEMREEKSAASAIDFNQTPETYLGYERLENFSSPERVQEDSSSNYSFPNSLAANSWALKGRWLIQGQRIISQESNNEIALRFNAQHVYAVMGANKPVVIQVLYNGAKRSQLIVKDQQLYELISFPNPVPGEIRLIISEPGVEIYTFTFG